MNDLISRQAVLSLKQVFHDNAGYKTEYVDIEDIKELPSITPKIKPIYTHNVAAEIVEYFEDLLDKHNITIPDEDRNGDSSEAAIYGMTYGKLLDEVEGSVIEACEKVAKGAEIITGIFE